MQRRVWTPDKATASALHALHYNIYRRVCIREARMRPCTPKWSVVLMAIAGASAANTPAAVTSVFRVFTDQLSWQAARSACQAKGGDLATISTQADNDALLAVLRSAHSSGRWPKSNGYGGAWIGAEDVSKEGRFDWVLDRAGSKYSNFNQGEPNNSGNED